MEQSSMTVKLPHKLLEYSSAFMNDLTENLSVHQISTITYRQVATGTDIASRPLNNSICNLTISAYPQSSGPTMSGSSMAP